MTLNRQIQHSLYEGSRKTWLRRVVWRTHLELSDIEQIRQLTTDAGLFESEETQMAALAALATLQKENNHQYIFAEINGRIAGYASYGLLPITEGRYMLHWLAVDSIYQGSGLGRALVAEVEKRLAAVGGSRFYAETSGKEGYLPTRRFYEKAGFDCVATYPDFYRDGDDKVVYCRKITA